jgi:hypothetical protein
MRDHVLSKVKHTGINKLFLKKKKNGKGKKNIE